MTSSRDALSSNSGFQTIDLDLLEFKNFDLKFLTTPIKINGIEGVFLFTQVQGPAYLIAKV